MDGNILANKSKDRRELDFYPTPWECTQALINTGFLSKTDRIWEPACGNGVMVKVFQDNGFFVVGSDIQDGTDFLTSGQSHFQAIITNPPFNLSLQFIEHCIQLNVPKFAMLLKSQYWHSAKRGEFFRNNPPAWIYPLTWRPDFRGGEKGGNPTMDVLWTCWEKGNTESRYVPLRKPTKYGP